MDIHNIIVNFVIKCQVDKKCNRLVCKDKWVFMIAFVIIHILMEFIKLKLLMG